MAVGQRVDPVGSYNFVIRLQESSSAIALVALKIGTPAQGGFSECSGLEMSMPPEEYREGGRNDTVLKFPSRVSWSNIRLRRGSWCRTISGTGITPSWRAVASAATEPLPCRTTCTSRYGSGASHAGFRSNGAAL